MIEALRILAGAGLLVSGIVLLLGFRRGLGAGLVAAAFWLLRIF